MAFFDTSRLVDFDETCDLVWAKFLELVNLRRVNRSGLILLGYYDRKVLPYGDADREENDLEHTAVCLILEFLVRKFFGKYFAVSDWTKVRDVLLIHEIGENTILDIADDGSRDEETKDRTERKLVKKFLADFPKDEREKLNTEFALFQEKTELAWLIDKTAFPLELAWYAKHGVEGSMEFKQLHGGGLSARDDYFYDMTKSDRPIDNVVGQYLLAMKRMYYRPIFFGIICAAYRDVYGEVPECLEKFY